MECPSGPAGFSAISSLTIVFKYILLLLSLKNVSDLFSANLNIFGNWLNMTPSPDRGGGLCFKIVLYNGKTIW